jgi:multidrug resistance efflux pump
MRRLALVLGLAFALLFVANAADAATLSIDGEVYARITAPLIPPAVNDMWQFNITQLAPDGGPVKKGDVVLAFDGSTLAKQLAEKNSHLQEKRRELDKLQLELAERERTDHLDTEKARAELDKAQRKTEQPQELIAGMEYRKLVVARQLAERKLALARERAHASADERFQEHRMVASETAQLQADVDRLQSSLAALNVVAPRSGLMMHKSNWSGEKFDVGTQVWMGQTVAEIPDTDTLAVRAELPERDLLRVHAGDRARIRIEGGSGSAYAGKVRSIGRTVRSKSQVQPIPVVDVEIDLDARNVRLKPGQPVRVELATGDATGKDK